MIIDEANPCAKENLIINFCSKTETFISLSFSPAVIVIVFNSLRTRYDIIIYIKEPVCIEFEITKNELNRPRRNSHLTLPFNSCRKEVDRETLHCISIYVYGSCVKIFLLPFCYTMLYFNLIFTYLFLF